MCSACVKVLNYGLHSPSPLYDLKSAKQDSLLASTACDFSMYLHASNLDISGNVVICSTDNYVNLTKEEICQDGGGANLYNSTIKKAFAFNLFKTAFITAFYFGNWDFCQISE